MYAHTSIFVESSGAVRKSRWPSWAPIPNKPSVSVDVKQHSAYLHNPLPLLIVTSNLIIYAGFHSEYIWNINRYQTVEWKMVFDVQKTCYCALIGRWLAGF